MTKDYIAALKVGMKFILVLGALVVVTMSSVQGEPVGDTWYVDSIAGDDLTGTGTSSEPFKTITHALGVASTWDTIRVEVGEPYDAANGEVFPIEMKRGVDIQGIVSYIINGSIKPTIHGGASYAIPYSSGSGTTTRSVSVLGADDASISGFKFIAISTADSPSGTSILCNSTSPIIQNNLFTGVEGHAGIATLGTAHPVIRDNYFTGWRVPSFSLNWGITVYAESYPLIESNDFVGIGGVDCKDLSHPTIDGNTFSCVGGTGIAAQSESNPTIVNNTLTGNRDYGIFIGENSTPMIQNNVITDNPIGISVACGGLMDPNPDIGGGGRSHGGNTFNNIDWDLENRCGNEIMARNNRWSSSPCLDFIDANDIYDDDEDASSGAVDFSTFGMICTIHASPRLTPWRPLYPFIGVIVIASLLVVAYFVWRRKRV